jgi:hypothetical protein
MCGIIAIVRRRTDRQPPTTAELGGRLAAVLDDLPTATSEGLAGTLARLGEEVASIDHELRGEAGLAAMLGAPGFVATTAATVAEIDRRVETIEAELEAMGDAVPALEAVNGASSHSRTPSGPSIGTASGRSAK